MGCLPLCGSQGEFLKTGERERERERERETLFESVSWNAVLVAMRTEGRFEKGEMERERERAA